jgi:energy-coupling factor transporter ATP-binding protein EcfA2
VTIEQDIAKWAASRPPWQQRVLRALAQGKSFDDAAVTSLADELIKGEESAVDQLSADEISGTSSTAEQVELEAIAEPQNVNRLLADETLTFAGDGITVVYGDNASGKSGYARIIKAAVGARHREPVHPDVFSDPPSGPQKATIMYTHGAAEETATWPGTDDIALRGIHFYDEACGDDYVGGETELTYRPSALTLLDGLIMACDQIHGVLDERLRDNQAEKEALPAVPAGSAGAQFLAQLRGTTTSHELDEATAVQADSAERIANLGHEEVRLRASSPQAERQRLEKLAACAKRVADHVAIIQETFAQSDVAAVKQARQQALELRAAAEVASSTTFDAEPVQGVGTRTWQALWEAARAFSEAEAYPGQQFPRTDTDSVCVLCQQNLSPEAANRVMRFDAFHHDTTEQNARAAEAQLRQLTQSLEAVAPYGGSVVADIAQIETADSGAAAAVSTWLTAAQTNKDALVAHLATGAELSDTALPASPVAGLRERADSLTTEAGKLDSSAFETRLGEIATAKNNLLTRQLLSEHRAELDAEVARLQRRAAIETARRATDTSAITRKTTELTRSHVTTLIRDRFTRETERLQLERVTLDDLGGQKGKLRHKPALLGAKVAGSVEQVLSEGEQTALGLAGYFTEAYFDGSKSSMVLDDPVSSLDHKRRRHVARRLAQFAKEHQVIVFSHDIIFVGELSRAAGAEKVAFTERCVERRGDGRTGICLDHHPWKAKDVGMRLNELEQELAHIKKSAAGWNEEEYEAACADWGGKLSETWERLVRAEVVNRVVDSGTAEVHPRSFRLFARISEEDDR